MVKFIVVTGGVLSSVGKGITTASIGKILKSYDYKVTSVKIDPYLNWDSGTLNPYQHGEVFVTSDGMETDLDLGHYERFLDIELEGVNNITTGKVYKNVIEKERRGEYLGECVQVIPHITSQILDDISETYIGTDYDIVLIELGGTVGDIESQPFLEALRQLKNNNSREDVLFVHVTYVPYLKAAGEYKTKPTQHSIKELRSMGLNPDIIICRSEYAVDYSILKKISHFCDVPVDAVINTPDASTIYEVPLILQHREIGGLIKERLNLPERYTSKSFSDWYNIVKSLKIKSPVIKIGVVGKYVDLPDAYISISEALQHASASNNLGCDIEYINSDTEKIDYNLLSSCDGVLIPGGFGGRGFNGKLEAVQYCMDNNVPLFGICLGMQAMLTQYARVNGLVDANSLEFSSDCMYPVVSMMEEQKKVKNMGGTMRLGTYSCKIKPDTIASKAYGCCEISERHRHRYEFNNDYREFLKCKGLIISGTSPDDFLVEIIEFPNHPWAVGCQFHPEFKSRPGKAHPLFDDFINACKEYHKYINTIEQD